jgi:hypothetical protein
MTWTEIKEWPYIGYVKCPTPWCGTMIPVSDIDVKLVHIGWILSFMGVDGMRYEGGHIFRWGEWLMRRGVCHEGSGPNE